MFYIIKGDNNIETNNIKGVDGG